MKIYIHYRDTDRPWGGVNSFVKAFKLFCKNKDIKLACSINEDYEIALITGPYKNREDLVDLKELINLKNFGATSRLMRFFLKRKPKVVIYRCDGFRDEYAGLMNNEGDVAQRELLDAASHIIFQNEFCLRSAQRAHIGYRKDNFSIIYNGVNQDIFALKKGCWDGFLPLKVISASWSKNPNKGFALIAGFSELPGVKVTFCGRWPYNIDYKKAAILAPKSQSELAREFTRHDVFLHPAKYDPSPNVCLEAISCGLPIIYHPTSGIKEVAGDCGIEINENDLQKTLYEIKDKYFALIERVRTKRDFYSIERCGNEYMTVFEKLTKNA